MTPKVSPQGEGRTFKGDPMPKSKQNLAREILTVALLLAAVAAS